MSLSLVAAACAREPSPAASNPADSPGGARTAGAVSAGASSAAPGTPGGNVLPTALVAWESNRTGGFRVWLAPLSIGDAIVPGAERQLSPDEPDREHCCPAISPDGARLLYASFPLRKGGGYAPLQTPVELRLVDLASGQTRTLSRAARLNGENRAAIWWSATSFVFVDAEGATRLFDLARGTNEIVVPASEGGGWLVAPDGRHANQAGPTFSERDPATGAIRLATELGGCQPAFTVDGDWGYWTAGAGGPIDVVELAARDRGEVGTRSILRRGDPRLPEGRRYLYFPAISPDRTLFAWGASAGGHDHWNADYDLFVALLDPERLELAGAPTVIAPSPAVDRYPDLWRLAAPRARSRAGVEIAPAAPTSSQAPPLLVWRSATDANRARAEADSETLDRTGAVWFDRRGRLALGGGSASFRAESARRIDEGLRAANAFSLGLLVEPSPGASNEARPLVTLARGPRQRGFSVRLAGRTVELLLRTGPSGPNGAVVPLVELPDAGAHHVAFRFSPGRLASFLDGRPARQQALPGDFFHWKNDALVLGADLWGGPRFRGWLSDLTIWDRELSDAELGAEAKRALDRFGSARELARIEARAKLVARSRPPTLEEISPYRSALVVEEYERVDSAGGAAPPARFRVARWALLETEPAPASRVPIGSTVALLLEPFDAQPQLESVVLADTLPAAPELPLYADVGVD